MTEPVLHHEERDVNIRAIFGFGIGLIAVAAIVLVAVWLLFSYFKGRESSALSLQFPLGASQATREPPEPRLQTTPRQDLQDLRQREDELLNSYRWVDRNAGTVRIPIKEAMRLTLERGLPARKASGQ